MWIRLRFDISCADLAYGAWACMLPADRDRMQREVEQSGSRSGDMIACLSVRSAFDLLLQSLQLPAGGEVLLSALTVPDMARILEYHGLVPIPIDLVEGGCTPSLDSLQRAITPATRALVVAHLFGTRIDMEPILAVARQHGLFVMEDCAQAYCGDQYLGHPASDAVMFSFGPIKTATALGGGLLRLRDGELARRIRTVQARYPVQSRCSFLCRVLRYAGMKLLSTRPLFSLITLLCRAVGIEQDALVYSAARNFPPTQLFSHLQRQPSVPLLRLLRRRLHRYDITRIARRRVRGQEFARRLQGVSLLRDPDAIDNSYWVFPILVDDQAATVERLRQAGLDATQRCRLSVVEPPRDRPELDPTNIKRTLTSLVFLPWYVDIPASVLERMANLLCRRPANVPQLPSWSAAVIQSQDAE